MSWCILGHCAAPGRGTSPILRVVDFCKHKWSPGFTLLGHQPGNVINFNVLGRQYQKVTFENTEPDAEFFNILDWHPESQTILVASSTKASLHSLHYSKAVCAEEYSHLDSVEILSKKINIYSEPFMFDFVIEFPLADKIISMTTITEDSKIYVYCVQTKTVQCYSYQPDITNPVNKQNYPSLLQMGHETPLKEVFGIHSLLMVICRFIIRTYVVWVIIILWILTELH